MYKVEYDGAGLVFVGTGWSYFLVWFGGENYRCFVFGRMNGCLFDFR
jgi:hypothetical protein